MENALARRQLLKTGAAASIVTGLQLYSTPAVADYAIGPTLRRNASTMVESDPILRGYRRAIRAMRALPDDNPCSWFYQAAIHGTLDPRNLQSWNTCHTDPTFFWAWHRMYLYWFERIVRKHSGMYDWAIPYWDWANPAERALPAAFRTTTSLLFDASRNAAVNGGANLSSGLGASVTNAMALLDYFNVQSSVNGPHGSVHVAVAGNMGAVASAAQDPIFWVHHAQVDRLWNLWLAQGGGRSSPVGNVAWRNTTYTFFDECCQPVTMRGCDVLRAALQLSYAYEGEPAQVNQYCPRRWFADIIRVSVLTSIKSAVLLRARPVRVALIPPREPEKARELVEILRRGDHRVAVQLTGVEAETQPGVSWEVHVGTTGFQPNPKSLIGTFALFSAGLKTRQQHYHPAEFTFSLGRALAGVSGEKFEVLFIPISGLDSSERALPPVVRSPVRIGEINVIIDARMQQPPSDEQKALSEEEQPR